MSPAEIALALRRSKCAIRYWLKKYGLGGLEDRLTGSMVIAIPACKLRDTTKPSCGKVIKEIKA